MTLDWSFYPRTGGVVVDVLNDRCRFLLFPTISLGASPDAFARPQCIVTTRRETRETLQGISKRRKCFSPRWTAGVMAWEQ